MTSTLTLRVAADSWNGDPQFIVTVDGQMVGGVYTATASHASGLWQDVTITGNFTATPSIIGIGYINDVYGGWGMDRNLYVQGLTIGSTRLSAAAATDGAGPIQNGVASLQTNGALYFNTAGLSATPSAPITVSTAPPATTTPPATTSPPATTASPTTVASTGATNSLVFRVAADSWNGSPQFIVTVDGQQIGGTLTATAVHGQGQWQDITVTGAFGASPKAVGITFINDAYGGWNQDRNLYVQSLTLNGTTLSASAAINTGGAIVNGVADVLSNGTVTFNTATAVAPAPVVTAPVVTPPVVTTPVVTAPVVTAPVVTPPVVTPPVVTPPVVAAPPASTTSTNTLILSVAADSWNGSPQFTVSVDGRQIGGTLTATAAHGQGQWQTVTVTGAFSATPASVAVSFINDAYGGWNQDRNLYVQSLTLGSTTISAGSATNTGGAIVGGVADVLSNGTVTFNTAGVAAVAAGTTAGTTTSTPATPVSTTPTSTTTTTTTGTNTLVLRVAADSWNGDPQFTVSVDGQQIGGTMSTAAVHGQGQWQDVTVTGAFSATPKSIAVSFTNDAYGGWNADRNLYVQSATIGGNTYAAGSATDTGGAIVDGVAQLLSNGTVTFGAATTAPASGSTPTGATTTTGSTASSNGLQLLGVNLAGAEFGFDKQPGTFGTDYTYPTHQEIDYYASKGLNVIRLPFLWERLETSLDAPLNTAELARITDVVNYAGSKNLKVILDPHDYGSGFGSPIGSAATPDSSFADFWGKLAGSFSHTSNVMFGLMNEPHVQSAADWLTAANDAIQSIRSTGANQEILVPGANWDTAATWTTSDNASVVGTGVKDPANNYAFEVHQYLDADNSGTHAGVAYDNIGVDRLTSITNWAESNGAKLFLGEFGVTQDTQSLSALNKMLSYMQGHSDVWQGGTYWAGGPWWYGSNIYGIEPNGLGTSTVTDQPQMAILTSHLGTAGS